MLDQMEIPAVKTRQGRLISHYFIVLWLVVTQTGGVIIELAIGSGSNPTGRLLET